MARKTVRTAPPVPARKDTSHSSKPARSRAEIEFDEPTILGALFG